MRNLIIAFGATALVACGSSSDAPPPAPAPPVYIMPEVLGVDALPDENPDPNVVEVTLSAAKAQTSYLAGKKASVFAYNGVLPGPLLAAKVGDRVIVHFRNDLSEPTTIHWHGLRISDQMDGSPRVQSPVKPGEEFTYDFTVPDAGSFWYHPHVQAAEQIEHGLYGPIVVFDPRDPTYDAQRFLVLDDVRLDDDGSISPASDMDGMMSGRLGNMLLTNGRPTKEGVASAEQGTVERWRIVNTANARPMKIGVEGASFRVIATDGGLLPEPYTTDRLLLPVGQRYDLEVTYDRPGTAKLVSYVETQDAGGNVAESAITAFSVDVTASERTPRVITWPAIALPDRQADVHATITFDVTQGPGGTEWLLNGKADSMDPLFTWTQGSTVEISLVNKIEMDHPFHLHGQFFEVLDAKQPGLKDVVLVPARKTVKIRAYIDNPGRWMAHCHILEHAEMGMMSEIDVTPDPSAPPLGPLMR
jgi:FtsP/CotA-like multicopper oxidase with cupredoxin domain